MENDSCMQKVNSFFGRQISCWFMETSYLSKVLAIKAYSFDLLLGRLWPLCQKHFWSFAANHFSGHIPTSYKLSSWSSSHGGSTDPIRCWWSSNKTTCITDTERCTTQVISNFFSHFLQCVKRRVHLIESICPIFSLNPAILQSMHDWS